MTKKTTHFLIMPRTSLNYKTATYFIIFWIATSLRSSQRRTHELVFARSPDFSLIFPPPLQPSGLAFFLGHYNKSVVFRHEPLLLKGVRCLVVRNIHNLINLLCIKANFRWNSVSFFSFFMS